MLRIAPLRKSASRTQLFMGGDREMTMFAALIFVMTGFTLATSGNMILGLILPPLGWVACLFVLRQMGKADPLMRKVYMRHVFYKKYYPARSCPERVNTKIRRD